MKVRYTDAIASREGRTIDVTNAAGRRLIDEGIAEAVTTKAAPKAETTEEKPTKKAAAKRGKAKP